MAQPGSTDKTGSEIFIGHWSKPRLRSMGIPGSDSLEIRKRTIFLAIFSGDIP